MPDPLACDDPLHALDRRIASAWAALSGARAVAWRSPSGNNMLIESMCERTLNELLERRFEMTSAPVAAK